MARFSEVLKIINGKNQTKVENPNGKYPIYGSGGIMGYADDYICNSDTVIIGRKGSINKPIFVETPFWNVDTAFGLEANREKLIPKYLFYFCQNFDFEKLNTTVTIPSLTKANLLDVEIPLVSIKEQEKIVNRLEKVDELISCRKEQLLKLDELVKAIFIELFGERLERDTVKLSALTEVITKGTTPTTLGFEFTENGVNFVKIECITEDCKFIVPKMLHISDECNKKLKRSILYEGDVLFSIAGAIGRTAIVTKEILPANTNQAVAIIRLKKDCGLNAKFLNQMLHSSLIEKQVSVKKAGVAQINLSLADIGDFNVIVPPIEEQNQFATFVEQTEKTKAEVQKSLDELETLKKSLMQKYFG